jgi:hypothetical protein
MAAFASQREAPLGVVLPEGRIVWLRPGIRLLTKRRPARRRSRIQPSMARWAKRPCPAQTALDRILPADSQLPRPNGSSAGVPRQVAPFCGHSPVGLLRSHRDTQWH